jgi:two-component system cell cycle sensor histidine kinase/response regulator CckA
MQNAWPEQRLYRLIYEHSLDATVVVDDDGRVLMMNRAARALPGVDVERLFRWSLERDPDLTAFRAQLRVGGRASGEVRVAPPGKGTDRVLALEGRAHGPLYVVILRDVTERRAQEAELRHLRRLESMGFMTASVVHDFNNVLTAMVCSAAVLSRTVEGQEAPAALAQSILSAGERATGLIRRVLRVLRRETAAPERVNLNAALEEARSLVELVAGSSVSVKLELDPQLADTVVDREQLDHVLLNLAANARDAMPGGGLLTLTTANMPSDDTLPGQCDPAGEYIALTVTDTGEGMTAEARERVFERFFTTTDADEGTGLGLAAAHRFVTQSGGCISVRSVPGQGTSVLVYLPRATALARVIQMSQKYAEPPRGTETVVVIEHDDDVRFVIRAALTDRGYRVIDAPSGELALRLVRLAEMPVDLVLADVGTPGVRGRAVAEAIGARLLLMSGLTDRQLAEHGVGGEAVLRKAFTPGELAWRVREALGPDAVSRPLQRRGG